MKWKIKMKFWNKRKDIRNRLWISVKLSHTLKNNIPQIKRILQLHNSNNKFYINVDAVWFENKNDMMICLLKYL